MRQDARTGRQSAMSAAHFPAFQAQMRDVSAGGLRDPQPVQGQQGDQRMVERLAKPGGL